MSTNQNTTQENSKKCLKKKKRIFKFFTILTIIIVLSSVICLNASALVIQDITDTRAPYPSLIMYISNSDSTENALVEVSGKGSESMYGETYVGTIFGMVSVIDQRLYIPDTPDYAFYDIARYYAETPFEYLYNSKPININLWEWSQEYNDNIIWQLWDNGNNELNNLAAEYKIEIPFFNNSPITGTEPLQIEIEKEIQQSITINDYNAYNIEIPEINEIITKIIEAIENESQSQITFQHKGEALIQNNYVTNIYAEDGSKIAIDFKKALSTILVNVRMSFNENGIQNIGIVNYNDYSVNGAINHLRTNDFRKLALENEFTRSAEITIERQDKEVGILNWLGSAISGIMSVEIFPNFSLGGLLSVIIMIPLILWILKLVAGG